MDAKKLEQELNQLQSNLRNEVDRYTTAISSKDWGIIKPIEDRVNKLLTEIKIKSLVHEDLIEA